MEDSESYIVPEWYEDIVHKAAYQLVLYSPIEDALYGGPEALKISEMQSCDEFHSKMDESDHAPLFKVVKTRKNRKQMEVERQENLKLQKKFKTIFNKLIMSYNKVKDTTVIPRNKLLV